MVTSQLPEYDFTIFNIRNDAFADLLETVVLSVTCKKAFDNYRHVYFSTDRQDHAFKTTQTNYKALTPLKL